MSLLARFFGFEDATPDGMKIAKILMLLVSAFSITFQISSTFWMIFIAQALGGGDFMLGLALVGSLVIVRLVVQTVLDYPTGALGDWIGQRWVIASALVCYGLGYWMTSIITPTTPYIFFLAIYVLFGVGASQESGAMPAWFDNNYRVAMPHDKDRKQFGVFSGRMGFLFMILSTAVLIPGSVLAVLLNRTWVFQFQAVASIVFAAIVLLVLKDLPGVREAQKKNKSLRDYGGLLKDGFKFLFSSKFVGFIILGEVVMFAAGMVWGELILFPLYFSYLLTDIGVSTYRSIVFVPDAIIRERSGVWSKRFDQTKWVPRFRLLQFGGFAFYAAFAAITFFFPPPPGSALLLTLYNPFNGTILFQIPFVSLIPVALIFTTFMITSLFANFAGILTSRIMIDVVPNRIRNSMYSLRPTLFMLAAIPLIYYLSQALPAYGFPPTFLVCAVFAAIGAFLIWWGFRYPIPKSEYIDEPIEAVGEPEALDEGIESPEMDHEQATPKVPVQGVSKRKE